MPPKPLHHSGAYQTTARRVVTAAYADPTTRCWRCGLTLAQHKPHHNGRRPWWTAGHLTDSEIDGPLAPEASTCNFAAGGKRAAELRKARQSLETTIEW